MQRTPPLPVYCAPMAVDHYENFPVASLLLPRHLRAAVSHVYHFARSADDIADEGDAGPEKRLARLTEYRDSLNAIADGRPVTGDAALTAVFTPLAMTIHRHALSITPFLDLLSAFEQDVHQTRYRDDAELFDYCNRSANPVGRIMLALYEQDRPALHAASDAICTGLQLTNFWQDVALDWHKGRVYIPLDRLAAAGLDESDIGRRVRSPLPPDPRWEALMRGQVAQARSQLLQGMPLADTLPGRIGLELRLVVLGGLRILERLDELHYDMFMHRPTLGKADWLRLLWRSVRHRRTAL